MTLHCSANEQWLRAVFLPSDAQGEGRGLGSERRHVVPNEVRACHMTSHLPGSEYAHRPRSLNVQTHVSIFETNNYL